MSAKRLAQYQIDQKTLQDKKECTNPTQQNGHSKTQHQDKQRKIVSVKKDENQNGISQNDKQQQNEPAKNTNGSLFSGLFNNSSNGVQGQGLFTNNSTTLPSTGLFPNSTPGLLSNSSSNLFNNNKTNTLFNTSNSLFSNNKPSDDTKPKGGLFASSGTSSIFNFQNGGVPPVKHTGSSLFSGNQNQGNGNEGVQDSGDSDQLQAAQNLEADPSKSTSSYKYEQTCKVLIKLKAFKFKRDKNDLIENVEVVLKQDNVSQMYFISVLLPATKKSIYTGIVIQSKSQVKHFNNKKQNVEVSAFQLIKQKLQQNILKFQFQKQEFGSNLYNTLEQVIKGTYVFPVQNQNGNKDNEEVKENVKQKKEQQKQKVEKVKQGEK